ncbi:BglG family transcription antiterminator [Streptomyces sp. Inha503]|uniref:BglG family transcription antiterminator n=1 Tax=Streptomyces sp. Inha503 TaxID=3383314 RepID=UPI0039A2CEC7
MTLDRREELLRILRRATGPVSGAALGAELHVSTRSVRQYVRAINAGAGEPVIRAGHHGYQLNLSAFQRLNSRGQHAHRRYETPQERLYFIARYLVTHQSGGRLSGLTELLSVSSDTIDGDLSRTRELFRAHGLRLRRDRDLLRVEGSERTKRQLVRQLLLDSGDGITPATLRACADDYRDFDLRLLRQRVSKALEAQEREVNEYVLSDLLIHLAITADRVRQGHTIGGQSAGGVEDPVTPAAVPQTDAAAAVAAAVDETLGVTLPPEERRILRDVIAVRSNPRRPAGLRGTVVDHDVVAMVRDTLRTVSSQYVLELGDESTIASLALHVQTLIARARAGQSLSTPLGASFKRMHPFVHELALLFASDIEARADIHLETGEIDFLAFHLGTHFRRQLEQGPLLTVTFVMPRYHDTHQATVEQLMTALRGQAVVENVITSLEHDWENVASDLIVSSVELPARISAPVAHVSPFLTRSDLDLVLDIVRAERTRLTRQTLRSNLLSLIDPRLFHHREAVASREEALALMCSTMAAEGYVEPDFLEDVLDRERRSTTAFGEQFAVPHSLYMNAYRTGVSVLVTDRPVPWGAAAVRLVVLFAVSSDQRHVFRDALDELIAVLSEPTGVSTLLTGTESHARFLAAMDDLLLV